MSAVMVVIGVALVPVVLASPPRQGAALLGVYGAATVAWVLVGVLVHRPRPLTPWVIAVVGGSLLLMNRYLRAVEHDGGWPGARGVLVPAIAWAGLGGVLVAVLVCRIPRSRWRRIEALALFDLTVAFFGSALPLWVLLVSPQLGRGGAAADPAALSEWVRLVLRPAGDLTVMLYIAQGLSGSRRRAPGLWLATAAAGFSAVADVAALVAGPQRSTAVTLAGALGACICVAAFAPNPWMCTLLPPVEEESAEPPRVLPALVMAFSLSVLLLLPAVASSGPVDRVARVVLTAGVLASFCGRLLVVNRRLALQRRHAHERATHDQLTGALNREGILQELSARVAVADQTLLYVDLDGFKAVNDTWGHQTGDLLLQQIVLRVARAVGEGDVVGRLGGDEFLVVTHGPPAHVRTLARRLQDAIGTRVWVSERVGDVRVTASIGGAVARQGSDAGAALAAADQAMLTIKTSAKAGFVMFSEGLHLPSLRRAEVTRALHGALREGELSVVYQPIVTGGGLLAGFEALARWTSARLGPVRPDEFIEVAEGDGSIHPIGAWVLDSACAQLAAWRAEGRGAGLHVSVNVSPVQLGDGRFARQVLATLGRYRLPARCLWLEITERLFVTEHSGAMDTLRRLRRAGVTLVVDDFGMGATSLAHLRHRLAGVLKLDRSFVAGIGASGYDEGILAGMATMAGHVGMSLVAEGVETHAQAEWLAGQGFEWQQGYLHGRPVPPELIRLDVSGPGMPSARAGRVPRPTPRP